MLVKIISSLGLSSVALIASGAISVETIYQTMQGSVAFVMDASKMRHQYIYSPYGVEKDLNEPIFQSRRGVATFSVLQDRMRQVVDIRGNALSYTGQITDKSTGLMMLGAFRNYVPSIGRFIQPDTDDSFSRSQVANPFAYVRANPLSFIDVSGHNADPVISFFRSFFQEQSSNIDSVYQAIINPNAVLKFLRGSLNYPADVVVQPLQLLDAAITGGILPEIPEFSGITMSKDLSPLKSAIYESTTPEYVLLHVKKYVSEQYVQIASAYDELDIGFEQTIKGRRRNMLWFHDLYQDIRIKAETLAGNINSVNGRMMTAMMKPTLRAQWYQKQIEDYISSFEFVRISTPEKIALSDHNEAYETINKLSDRAVSALKKFHQIISVQPDDWFATLTDASVQASSENMVFHRCDTQPHIME